MISPIAGHSVWNIKFFFVYSDLMMGITNIFPLFELYYLAPVTTMCCESQDGMSLQVMCRPQWSRGLRRESASLACWDCGFEYLRGHRCLSLVNVVCCQVKSQRLITRPKESYRMCCVWMWSRDSEKGEAMNGIRAEAPYEEKEKNILDALNVKWSINSLIIINSWI